MIFHPIHQQQWRNLQAIKNYTMYLYGASGHGKVIIDILKSNGISIDGIIDDNLEINQLLTYSVSGKYDPDIMKKTIR